MKAPISNPDETFERDSRSERPRHEPIGVVRLSELDTQSLTGQIDNALARLDGIDATETDAVGVGRRVLGATDDGW